MKTRSTSRLAQEERCGVAIAPAGAQLKRAASANMPDTRAASLAQLKLQRQAGSSSQAAQLKERAEMMGGRGADAPAQRVDDEELLQGKFAVAQREEDDELLQGKFEPVQRMDEEDLLQGKFEALRGEEAATPLQGGFEQLNDTGLPDQLKSGIESLSGMNMDHVKVHYNSDKPAQLRAHAYAQGSEIHVGPGQERHLPHEAWHVVQQAQGRVMPTRQMKTGVPVNDEVGLETEADVMGAKAMRLRSTAVPSVCRPSSSVTGIQAKFYRDGDWMTDVADDVIDNRFAVTTRTLWKALKSDGPIVGVDQGGSGASYSFNHRAIQISKDWLDAVKAYVSDSGQKDAKLMRATTALTHEMSHAHDHQVRRESPEGASRETDDWVLGVLKTELRAWMKEARSGIENHKDKAMLNSDDDRDLQYSWVALSFVPNEADYLALKSNLVIGRLNKYYNDNKSAGSSSLAELVAGGLNALIADYATQIRRSDGSTDAKMRSAVATYMA